MVTDLADAFAYAGEDLSDLWAKQYQDGDYDDGYQEQDQSVFYEALAFFFFSLLAEQFLEIQHDLPPKC
jgi:hypothetical protein